MICISQDEYKVEHYKDYKNRTVTKHLDKIKNQIRQIKDCSLHGDDNKNLIQQMLKIIQES